MSKRLKTMFGSQVFGFVGTGGGMGAAYFHNSPGSAGFSSPVSSFASYVALLEPSFWWKMNDASAAVYASETMNAAHASIVAQASAGYSTMVDSTGDSSWNFDGVNDALVVREGQIGRVLNGAAAITIVQFLEMDVWNANDASFVTYVGDDGTTRFGLNVDCTTNNVIRFGARSQESDGLQTLTHTVSAGERNRPLMFTGIANFGTDTMAMFLDDVKVVASTAKTFGSTVYGYNSAGITFDDHIGAIPDSSRWGNLRVGHTMLFNRALSSTEVVQLYNRGKGFPKYHEEILNGNPVAYFPMAFSTTTGVIDNEVSAYATTTHQASIEGTMVFGASSLLADDGTEYTNAGIRYGAGNARARFDDTLHRNLSSLLNGSNRATVEMWVEASALAANQAMFTTYLGNTTGFYLQGNSGSIIRVASRSQQSDSANEHFFSATSHKTYHIMCCADYKNGTMKIHVNGSTVVSSQGASVVYGSVAYSYNSGGQVSDDGIGFSHSAGRYWDGIIGHVALYNKCFTENDAERHYRIGNGETKTVPAKSTITSSYYSAVISASPGAFWTLDGVSAGASVPEVIANDDGAFTSTTTRTRSMCSQVFDTLTEKHYSYEFPASGVFVSTPYIGPQGSDARTIEVVFSTTTSVTSQGLLVHYGGTTSPRRYLMAVNDSGKMRLETGAGRGVIFAGVVNDGAAHHVCFSNESGGTVHGTRCFIDGVSAAVSTTLSTDQTLNTSNTYKVHFGWETNWHLRNTWLDSVAVYTTALSSATMAKHANLVT